MQNVIRDRRLELGLTMKEVANAVGVSEATVSRWESGDIADMKRSRIFSLSKVLQISPLVILGYSEENEKQPSAIEGLSEEALMVAQIIDRLPPEGRRLILAQVRAAEQALLVQASAPESPKSQ